MYFHSHPQSLPKHCLYTSILLLCQVLLLCLVAGWYCKHHCSLFWQMPRGYPLNPGYRAKRNNFSAVFRLHQYHKLVRKGCGCDQSGILYPGNWHAHYSYFLRMKYWQRTSVCQILYNPDGSILVKADFYDDGTVITSKN